MLFMRLVSQLTMKLSLLLLVLKDDWLKMFCPISEELSLGVLA